MISCRSHESLVLVIKNDIARGCPDCLSLEIYRVLNDLNEFDGSPRYRSFRNRFDRNPACLLDAFARHWSFLAVGNLSEMKGSTEQDKTIVILSNYPADINVFVLTLEKAPHSYPDIFLGEGVCFHKRAHYVLVLKLLQINFQKKSDGIGKKESLGIYCI